MRLDEVLIDSIDRFLDEIFNEEKNDELTEADERLRDILTDEDECLAHLSDVEVLEIVQSELDEVWHQISQEEKCKNPILKNLYKELVKDLNRYMVMAEKGVKPQEGRDY